MLKPEVSSGFMATSVAVLATEVPTMVADCQGKSFASPSCMNQLAETSSLIGFINRALSKARKLAEEGKIKECEKVLPASLASTIGETMSQFLDYATNIGKINKAKEKESAVRAIFQPDQFTKICETQKEQFSARNLTDEELKKVLLTASKGSLSEEQAKALLNEIKSKGAEKVFDEQLTQDEEAVEKKLQEVDKASSLISTAGSLMELSSADQAQLQGIFNGLYLDLGLFQASFCFCLKG